MRTRFFLTLAFSCLLAVSQGGPAAQAAASYPDDNPEGDTGALKTQVTTGGSYDAQSGNATRIVNDLKVPDALGVYGLDFTRYWNSLHPEDTNFDAEWPRDFGESGWSHSWKWTAVYGDELPDFEQHPAPPHTYITSITITFPDGHATKFKIARTDQVIAGGVEDPRCGPPYSNPGESDWPSLGPTVHDKLVDMTETGSEFWLSRADGGAVHFVGLEPPDTRLGYAIWSYEAREVIDPHGLHTQLHYTNGYLDRVTQDGGRSLVITWGSVNWGSAIASVDSKGKNGEQLQHVSYLYSGCAGAPTLPVLSKVIYEDEPAPGQTSSAVYTYSMDYGDTPNGAGQYSSFPLLKTANDPHYAGAMTKIGYKYHGDVCPSPTPVPNPSPNPYSNWFHWKRDCVAEERNPETSKVVARFDAVCGTAFRKDYNGLGGWRLLAFGSLQEHPEMGDVMGFQLTKVTDFYPADLYPSTWICRKQNGTEPTKAWDARGILTEMAYLDASGSPSQIHYPFPADGGTRSYDRVHPELSGSADPGPDCIHNLQHLWLFQKTDELGNYTLYRRDARRRITNIFYYKVGGMLMASEAYTYNGNNQVTSHTLASGATVTYQYDSSDHLVLEWNSEDTSSNYTQYDYDSLGRVDWVQDPLMRSYGKITTMAYNGRHQVTKVTYPATDGGAAPFVTYEYDNYGNCTGIVDELGHRKDYAYDWYRRCTSYTEQINACGVASRTWEWFYDRVIETGNNTYSVFPASAHTSNKWRWQYDPPFNDNGERRVTTRTFDFNDRILSEQKGFRPNTSTERFAYDPNGQKSKYTDPRLRETTYTYDFRNRLETTIEPNRPGQSGTTQFHYDLAGNKTMVEFPDTKTQQWEDYDPFGQAWKFTDELFNVTNLVYSCGPMKKLKQVITHRDPNGGEVQPTTFNYDTLGRLYQTVFPDGSDEFSTYQFGRCLNYWKTRRNQGKHIHYDARGREDSHYWENGTAPGINRVWDAANRLTSITNAFSAISYTYDDASQMLTESSNVTGSNATRQLQYCRYPTGEVSHLTFPGGSVVVNLDYTARGQLGGVGWPDGSTSYVYLADGKVDYQARTNGVKTSYGYDERGIVSSVSNTNPGDVSLAHREYWRDERDRILAWKRGGPIPGAPNGMEDGRGDRYRYDDEGQLKEASYRLANPEGSPAGPAVRTDVFHYDAMGNRVGSNHVASRGDVDFNRRNNGLNQYQDWTPSAIYYDDNLPPQPSPSPWPWIPHGNGVTMADGWITASFNALNQPMAMWSWNYGQNTFLWFGYDPLGRCVKRWTGDGNGAPVGPPAIYYYYDGSNLVQEGSGGTSVDRTYVHGGRVDAIVASQVGGLWYFHHYDGQGNCMMLTTAAGAIQEQYDYDAFGFPYFYGSTGAKFTTPAHTRFLFTGREWLSDLRIYDYRARQYQPELGRFLQPDPKQFDAGDYNLYRYCHNDPVNKSDPTGLQIPEEDLDPEVDEAQEEAVEPPRQQGEVRANRFDEGNAATRQVANQAANWLQNFFRNLFSGGGQQTSEPNAGEPIGRSGEPLVNSPQQATRNQPATIGGQQFSGHALDQMQNRGIMPSVTRNTINEGSNFATRPGTTGYYDPVNNIRVITSDFSGQIVTVIPGPP